ncbi:hypothetical protein ACI3K5_24025 [Streptomyces sp. MPA0124]|uniref:hypothetical protein n=1 Tax=Streptomyces sp. MPA0124 TaxID=3378069 RepID=UPI00385543D8
MNAVSLPAPVVYVLDLDSDQSTTHVFCCNPDRALCGHDVSNDPEVDGPTPTDCVVCLDLEEQPCPVCGYQPDTEEVAS